MAKSSLFLAAVLLVVPHFLEDFVIWPHAGGLLIGTLALLLLLGNSDLFFTASLRSTWHHSQPGVQSKVAQGQRFASTNSASALPRVCCGAVPSARHVTRLWTRRYAWQTSGSSSWKRRWRCWNSLQAGTSSCGSMLTCKGSIRNGSDPAASTCVLQVGASTRACEGCTYNVAGSLRGCEGWALYSPGACRNSLPMGTRSVITAALACCFSLMTFGPGGACLRTLGGRGAGARLRAFFAALACCSSERRLTEAVAPAAVAPALWSGGCFGLRSDRSPRQVGTWQSC